MKRKYLAFAFVMVTFAACKKDASSPDPQPSSSTTITTLAKNFDIANPTRESLVSIVNFLDTASAEDRKALYNTIYPVAETNKNSKIADANPTGPTATDVAGSMNPLVNPNDDPDAFYTTGPGPYGFSMLYNWTLLSSPISTYIVMSTERCELSDGGPNVDLDIRYAFNGLSHAGSHIVGITFGTGWTEVACDQYKGNYTCYSTVQGVLSGLVFDISRVGTRIFNAGAVIISNGRNSRF